jgi:predicted secreted protein
MTYLGAMRWGQVRDQYDTPMFRRHCQRLAESLLDQAEEYRRAGYRIVGFVLVDGSPVCGLNRTPQPAQPDVAWGGMTCYLPESRQVQGKGVFAGILHEAARTRPMLAGIPFGAYPESVPAGADQEAVEAIRRLL